MGDFLCKFFRKRGTPVAVLKGAARVFDQRSLLNISGVIADVAAIDVPCRKRESTCYL